MGAMDSPIRQDCGEFRRAAGATHIKCAADVGAATLNDGRSSLEARAAAAAVSHAARHVDWTLAHSAFSGWLKTALRTALELYPVSVANDVEILRHLLHAWTQFRRRLT